jgi:hypothetical protein
MFPSPPFHIYSNTERGTLENAATILGVPLKTLVLTSRNAGISHTDMFSEQFSSPTGSSSHLLQQWRPPLVVPEQSLQCTCVVHAPPPDGNNQNINSCHLGQSIDSAVFQNIFTQGLSDIGNLSRGAGKEWANSGTVPQCDLQPVLQMQAVVEDITCTNNLVGKNAQWPCTNTQIADPFAAAESVLPNPTTQNAPLDRFNPEFAGNFMLEMPLLASNVPPSNSECQTARFCRSPGGPEQLNAYTQADDKEVLRFGEDHSVFGAGGVMRGIKVRFNKTKKTTSYFLDKGRNHGRADIISHNGHSVGDCWPYQICLLRDGIHGSLQGGIYGNKASGAYSIVVLGDSVYATMDQDVGDKLYYSGSGSLENTDPDNPKETEGTAALQTSALNKNPVRVIRGKNKMKKGAPKAGFRYDGLYKVVAQEQLINGKGGAYLRFKLERLPAQPLVDQSRPNADDMRKFWAIKEAVQEKCK